MVLLQVRQYNSIQFNLESVWDLAQIHQTIPCPERSDHLANDIY